MMRPESFFSILWPSCFILMLLNSPWRILQNFRDYGSKAAQLYRIRNLLSSEIGMCLHIAQYEKRVKLYITMCHTLGKPGCKPFDWKHCYLRLETALSLPEGTTNLHSNQRDISTCTVSLEYTSINMLMLHWSQLGLPDMMEYYLSLKQIKLCYLYCSELIFSCISVKYNHKKKCLLFPASAAWLCEHFRRLRSFYVLSSMQSAPKCRKVALQQCHC